MMLKKYICLLGAGVYCTGLFGLTTNKRSLLLLLVFLEMALLGVVLIICGASLLRENPLGQLYALMVLVAAASESAIGLSLVILWFRTSDGSSLSKASRIRG